MGIEVGDKKVKKIMVGDKVIYRNSDGWIPLELPDSAIDGLVLFRDNGDGTASIAGAAHYKLPMYGEDPIPMLLPPSGYEFTKTDWNANNLSGGLTSFYGKRGDSTDVFRLISTSIIEGKVNGRAGSNAEVSNVTIFFTQNSSKIDGTAALPATIGITKL